MRNINITSDVAEDLVTDWVADLIQDGTLHLAHQDSESDLEIAITDLINQLVYSKTDALAGA